MVANSENCDPGLIHDPAVTRTKHQAATSEAEGEERIGVIDDECFVGCDRTFVTMTDRGSALLSARAELLELAEALSDIRTWQSAELAADRLRQARDQQIRF